VTAGAAGAPKPWARWPDPPNFARSRVTAALDRATFAQGGAVVRDLDRWDRPASGEERALLAGVAAPVIHLGCGLGRLVVDLAARRVPGLGVDVSPGADAVEGLGRAAGLAVTSLHPTPSGPWFAAMGA
jgi:hypothetical protein